jgi:hypothetical protein
MYAEVVGLHGGNCRLDGGYKTIAPHYIQIRGIALADDYPLIYREQPCFANPIGVRYQIVVAQRIHC